jgi:hypothetical protein
LVILGGNINMSNLTIDIKREDCVGDSVSKHNFNIINLDTFICNLSSSIFMKNGIFSTFTDISANSSKFKQFASTFSNNQVSSYDVAYTATNFLSSYWEKSEIFVSYPSVISLNNPKETDAYISSTNTSTLSTVGLRYLNNNYPVANYLDGTRINLQFLLYNQLEINDSKSLTKYYIASGNTQVVNPNYAYKELLDDYDKNLIGWNYQPTGRMDTSISDGFNVTDSISKPFNDGVKSVRCDFTKTSITINEIAILRYYKINNQWKYNLKLTV